MSKLTRYLRQSGILAPKFDTHPDRSILLYAIWQEEKRSDRNADPRRLIPYGRKAFSQADEDGIIAEIFRRIGTSTRRFVEFGVQDGIESNTTWLLMQGWSGLWMEADDASCDAVRKNFAEAIADRKLTLTQSFVNTDNIERLILDRFPDGEIDVLSIDIDSNDYWVWEALTRLVRPRLVVIEYNAQWPPPASLVIPYKPDRRWNGTSHYGASLSALAALGKRKGYDLVGCSVSGVNAFFVRQDLTGDHFVSPGSAEDHYEPPRFFLAGMNFGHRPAFGPVEHVD
jgi:hypothetical protein